VNLAGWRFGRIAFQVKGSLTGGAPCRRHRAELRECNATAILLACVFTRPCPEEKPLHRHPTASLPALLIFMCGFLHQNEWGCASLSHRKPRAAPRGCHAADEQAVREFAPSFPAERKIASRSFGAKCQREALGERACGSCCGSSKRAGPARIAARHAVRVRADLKLQTMSSTDALTSEARPNSQRGKSALQHEKKGRDISGRGGKGP